ncbi:MAG: immunoglobulin domain-containing protein, partial [Verrucomicrobiota bacterium]
LVGAFICNYCALWPRSSTPAGWLINLFALRLKPGSYLCTNAQSQLDLEATLQVAANFHDFKLTQFQAQLTGTATFELDVHAQTGASADLEESVGLISPIHNVYWASIGPVPVWVDVMFEVNAGYTAHFDAAADVTDGVSGVKTVTVGEKWALANGCVQMFENPPLSLDSREPTWQVQGSADLRAYLEPKVSVLIYSAAGVSADLQPYLELQGSAQVNPPQWALGLYGGLDSTFGVDLSAWDDSLGQLPDVTFNLIPETELWQSAGPSVSSGSPAQPVIVSQPQNQSASLGSTVAFSVQANGSDSLSYRWHKNGLYLTDDNRISGSSSSALRIANVQSSDGGSYDVHVGPLNSDKALLTVTEVPPPNAQGGYALFSEPTDTISVNGHTSVTNQMTIEAETLIPSSLAFSSLALSASYPSASDRIFAEQKCGYGDKGLGVSPSHMWGEAWTAFASGMDDPGISVRQSVDVNVWHHIAFVRDGEERRLYLDGELIGTRELAGTPYDLPIVNAPDSTMAIGAFFYTCQGSINTAFLGGIQWVRMSNVARYAGSFALPPGTVPSPDSFTLVLFDFSNIQPGTWAIDDLSSNHFRGTVATGFTGATAPTFVPPSP